MTSDKRDIPSLVICIEDALMQKDTKYQKRKDVELLPYSGDDDEIKSKETKYSHHADLMSRGSLSKSVRMNKTPIEVIINLLRTFGIVSIFGYVYIPYPLISPIETGFYQLLSSSSPLEKILFFLRCLRDDSEERLSIVYHSFTRDEDKLLNESLSDLAIEDSSEIIDKLKFIFHKAVQSEFRRSIIDGVDRMVQFTEFCTKNLSKHCPISVTNIPHSIGNMIIDMYGSLCKDIASSFTDRDEHSNIKFTELPLIGESKKRYRWNDYSNNLNPPPVPHPHSIFNVSLEGISGLGYRDVLRGYLNLIAPVTPDAILKILEQLRCPSTSFETKHLAQDSTFGDALFGTVKEHKGSLCNNCIIFNLEFSSWRKKKIVITSLKGEGNKGDKILPSFEPSIRKWVPLISENLSILIDGREISNVKPKINSKNPSRG